MKIDDFYSKFDKSNYYLGRVSQVFRTHSVVQIENLSLLSHRLINEDVLTPNTINYLVVIESIQGIFIGEVFQLKTSSSDNLNSSINNGKQEYIYPELSIDILGIMTKDKMFFKLPGFKTVGITDKVYLANKSVISKYINSIELNNSNEEVIPHFANLMDMDDDVVDVNLKPSTLFNRHLFAIGTTNSGKSTTSLSILDKLIKSKKKVILIDPTGEYSESFNDEEVKKLNLGKDTIISIGNISMEQWAILFDTNGNSQGPVLSEAIRSLRYQHKVSQTGIFKKVDEEKQEVQRKISSLTDADLDFDIRNLPNQIMAEAFEEPKNNGSKYIYSSFKANSNKYLFDKVSYQFTNTKILNFFSSEPTKFDLINELKEFVNTENSSIYINTSYLGLGNSVGGMIIDLICTYLLNEDVKYPFVFFVDEVHRYTKSQLSESEFHSGLTLIAREGRKKGIFLFLTTQNPQDVSPILLGQIGTLLIHRLTHNDEIRVVQNYLDEYSLKQVKKLNQGECILTSINLLKNIFIRVLKCNRIQKNQTPLL